MNVDDYLAGFLAEPGYLDYARIGPLSATVVAETHADVDALSRARSGALSMTSGDGQRRLREAASVVTGFPADQIVGVPSTGTALMMLLFGITGGVLCAADAFPTMRYAVARSAEALHVVEPGWLPAEGGRITPAAIRDALTPQTAAVLVPLVDSTSGFVADLEGIRQVIGDRLLLVDAIQGIGVVDAPFEVADAVATGGYKWLRAGKGTGFLALSERALDNVTPVISGAPGVEDPYSEEIQPPVRGAESFLISAPDHAAGARLAVALEEVAAIGVETINGLIAERVERILTLSDEFAVPVLSPRDPGERAGIVALEPAPDRLSALTAALHNHGVTATVRGGQVRLSAHAGTDEETFSMLRSAFTSYAAS